MVIVTARNRGKEEPDRAIIEAGVKRRGVDIVRRIVKLQFQRIVLAGKLPVRGNQQHIIIIADHRLKHPDILPENRLDLEIQSAGRKMGIRGMRGIKYDTGLGAGGRIAPIIVEFEKIIRVMCINNL